MHITSNPSAAASFAKVALPVPVRTAFTYEIPKDLLPKVFVGCRVEVPFGRRILSGIVVQLSNQTDVSPTKPLRKIYETYLPDELLGLTEWIASYYGCSVGEAAQSVLPPLLKKPKQRTRMTGTLLLKPRAENPQEIPQQLERARRQLELACRLDEAGGRAPLSLVFGEWGFTSSHVKGLLKKHSLLQ